MRKTERKEIAPQTFEYFFDLPPELRQQILSHLCFFPTGILVGGGVGGRSVPLKPPKLQAQRRAAAGVNPGRPGAGSGTTHDPALGQGWADGAEDDDDDDDDENEEEEEEETSADPPVNLFLASPVLYREAGAIYYGRNVFHLDFVPLSSRVRNRLKQKRRRQQQHHQQQGGMGLNDSDWSPFGPSSLSPTSTLPSVLDSGFASASASASASTSATASALRTDVAGGGNATLLRLLTQPATAAAPARRRIRCAVVYVKRFGALVLDLLVPALEDMVLNGALRRLTVDVLEAWRGAVGGGRGRRWRGEFMVSPRELGRLMDADYAANPALRALLVLLTDPDLERASLRVPRALHARFWCGFHEARDPQDSSRSAASGGLSEARGPRRRDGSGCGLQGFLEVDVHRLVDACAGDAAEFRIKKVGLDR